jgi:hypothetical protein
MSRRNNYDVSYSLEHVLAQSIDKVKDNVTKQHKMRREIIKLRKQRRQLDNVPDEVKQWFDETEGMDEENEQ